MFSRLNAALRGAGRASASILFIAGMAVHAQDAAAPKQALEHVLGTVTALNAADHTVTVKEDKTGTEYSIQLATTKTLLKVEPGAKDLKSATRITADDLQVGDRVEARGTKPADNPNGLVARSVVLMSGRALAQTHQAQAAEWQHATNGMVSSIDTASGKISITTKTPEGPRPVVLNTAKNTEFTRYTPENPQTPATSQLAQLQIGDQVRVVGDKSADGSSIEARKVYSGAFRTISATVVSVGADGKSATVKDLSSKKPVAIALTDDAAIHKLPPPMAAMLARRFNPDARAGGSGSGPGGAPGGPRGGGQGAGPGNNAGAGASPDGGAGGGHAGPDGAGGGMRRGNGDMSQLLERAPKITVADLKPGDALVISGVATGADNSRILASTIIAGVEPILQAAPTRQGRQDLGGDWGLGEMAAPPQ
ncbi:MAG TPA: hypothetical protein VGG97_26240 [Bryobacteraceae bacterium]